MTEPIIFISRQKIKQGKFDAYVEYYRQVAAMTEATKPGTVAHLAYANAEGTEASIIHVFPDAQAMARHMQGVGELAEKASEFMEIVGFEIYGKPGDAILEGMQRIGGAGVTLDLLPRPLGGYLRKSE